MASSQKIKPHPIGVDAVEIGRCESLRGTHRPSSEAGGISRPQWAPETPTNQAFLIAAFQGCPPSEAPWVTGFPGDPAKVPPYLWGGRPILRGMPGCIQRPSNNYVCVSTFKADADGTWHRRKSSFAAMYTVMVDDVGTKVPAAKLALEPSVLVETSPGNFQAWYFLDPPERNAERAALVVKRMIQAGLTADGADPGMRGVTRYGRLPVGRNAKAKYVEQLGAPFAQRVATWNLGLRYSLDAIAAAYQLSLTPERSRVRPAAGKLKGENDDLLRQLERLELYVGSLPNEMGAHQIVCPWVHEHTDEDTSGTVYFEPSHSNGWRGGFKCHHGHCMNRGIKTLRHFLRAVARKETGSAS